MGKIEGPKAHPILRPQSNDKVENGFVGSTGGSVSHTPLSIVKKPFLKLNTHISTA